MSRMLVSLPVWVVLALGADRPAGAQDAAGGRAGASPPVDAGRPANDDSGDANRGSRVRILETVRVSTMERELNEAAAHGFRLQTVGAEFGFEGGVNQIVALLVRDARPGRFTYRLLTLPGLHQSGMEEEHAQALTRAAAESFRYRGLVPSSQSGTTVVLEHDADTEAALVEYLVLATYRLSTLERELDEAVGRGYEVIALTMDGGGLMNRVALLSRPANAFTLTAGRR